MRRLGDALDDCLAGEEPAALGECTAGEGACRQHFVLW